MVTASRQCCDCFIRGAAIWLIVGLALFNAGNMPSARALGPGRVDRGTSARYWGDTEPPFNSIDDNSLVFGEVTGLRIDAVRNGEDFITVKLIGTIAGHLDASALPVVSAYYGYSDDLGRIDHDRVQPPRGSRIVAVVFHHGGIGLVDGVVTKGQEYLFGSAETTFMPNEQPIAFAPRLNDVVFEDILAKVQAARKLEENPRDLDLTDLGYDAPPEYWKAHSLIVAKLKESSDKEGRTRLLLRPKLRLSGPLDPGNTTEIAAEIDPERYGKNFKVPRANAFVLVLLTKKNDSYFVSPELETFMPDDHSPICEIKDVDDPKFTHTLKAVQELRKNKDKR